MVARFVRLLLVASVVSHTAVAAYAQAPAGAAALTDEEKAAVATMLDSIGTKRGDDLRQSLSGTLQGLSNAGRNPRAVMTVVKMGAGTQLGTLNQALADLCLNGGAGGRMYCQLAALQASAEVSDVQTAATEGAPAAPAANTVGGAPITNSGSNNGASTTTTTPSLFLSTTPTTFSTPTFTFTSRITQPTITPTPAPGPVAGAGIPAAALVVGWLWARAHRKARSTRTGAVDSTAA